MIRMSSIFVAICMMLIAASLGLILHSVIGISATESAIVSLAVLTFLIFYNAIAMRVDDRGGVKGQIAGLSQGTADLARQVAEFGRRLAAIENRLALVNATSQERVQAIAGEISELGTLVKQLADSVATHDDLLVAHMVAPSAAAGFDRTAPIVAPSATSPATTAAAPVSMPPSAAPTPSSANLVTTSPAAPVSVAPNPVSPGTISQGIVSPDVSASGSAPAAQASPEEMDLPASAASELSVEAAAASSSGPSLQQAAAQLNDTMEAGEAPAIAPSAAMISAIKTAIASDRLDVYLQPMVTLPQRKVRFYEAVTRLRDQNEQVLAADDFIATAETAGMIGQIDHMMLQRCIQVLRRLMVRNKDVGLFCNMSVATLTDAASFAQCLAFLDDNRALAASLIIEVKHSTIRNLGPKAAESLAALAQRGYSFSIDHVTDLRFEPRELAERGVRFIKVPAALLLDQTRAATSDIHPSDLSDLLGRYGIDLVAERIEGELAVVDLLDYDVKYGQGFLFSAPRPLRPEAASATGGSSATERAPPQDSNGQRPSSHEPARTGTPRVRVGNAALARRVTQG